MPKLYICCVILNFIKKMDRKSQKLTNILLFIIVCFFVLGALCALWKAVLYHKWFDGKIGGYKMQWQCKNFEKWCMWEKWGCPYVDEKIDVVTNTVE